MKLVVFTMQRSKGIEICKRDKSINDRKKLIVKKADVHQVPEKSNML